MQTTDYIIIMIGLVLIVSTITEAIASSKKRFYKSLGCKKESIDALQTRIMALEEKLGMQSPTETVPSTQE